MKRDPDCVIALSFGAASIKSVTDINKLIALRAEQYKLPLIAQIEIANYCTSTSKTIGKKTGYLDSWEVLLTAKSEMEEKGFDTAILLAHKAHFQRVMLQASKAGINYIVATELPDDWDKHSKQWWTRSLLLWKLHEFFTVPYLKILHKI